MVKKRQLFIVALVLTVVITSVSLFGKSFGVVGQNEFGLLQNTITQSVDTSKVYKAGRHFVWYGHTFILFPSHQVTVRLGDCGGCDGLPVAARTGGNPQNPDGGGQSVTISLSFQFQFQEDTLKDVYSSFGINYKPRFVSYARKIISDVVNKYAPSEFWQSRRAIVNDMHTTLNAYMMEQASTPVVSLQVTHVGFTEKFEDQIVANMVESRKTFISKFQQQVETLLAEINKEVTRNNAEILGIAATANAEAKYIKNTATTAGFRAHQGAKSLAYEHIKGNLTLSNDDLIRFIKLQAIRNNAGSRMVVGIADPLDIESPLLASSS